MTQTDQTCPLCGHDKLNLIWDAKTWFVNQCHSCGLVFQPNRDEAELEKYYKERETVVTFKWSGNVGKRLSDVCTTITTKYPEGNLLDVGCGSGEWIDFLSQKGLVCTGLEPNEEQANFANNEKGLTVVAKPLNKGLFSPDTFDVITFIQVLEHVTDPVNALSIVFDYVKPGGMVIINVPSYNNPRFLLYRSLRIKSVVKKDFIRPHLFYYTPKTLSAFVEKSGYDILRIDCGRYNAKFGPNPLLRLADKVANRFHVGGITLYAMKPEKP